MTRALSALVRGKVLGGIQKNHPEIALPRSVFKNKKWVTWCKPWGDGQKAVLEYLARYAFRIAITNHRITSMDHQTVSFRYKDRKSEEWRIATLPGMEFIRRFLQHVLPRGFHKIRYSGLWHPTKRAVVQQVRLLLQLESKPTVSLEKDIEMEKTPEKDKGSKKIRPGVPCPVCKKGILFLTRRLSPKWSEAP
ncbi:MAG: transposase [Magnetococcales bacterium]|nr:transposase [Magnetococcales bacterium]